MDNNVEAQVKQLNTRGITVNDLEYFARQSQAYGYHEIVDQYLPHFAGQKRSIDFNDIADLYHLDQQLKNVMMVSLQLFEQSFKVALAAALPAMRHGEIFKEAYRLEDGRVIRRGDLKARIRRIKQHYLEPFAGYRQAYNGEITPWVLVKEMSFGVATNAFFLLGSQVQTQVLARVFKAPLSVEGFDKLLADVRLFRRRAAHNYPLLGIKSANGRSFYRLMLADLALLKNQAPFRYAKEDFQAISTRYLGDHPTERDFLRSNIEP
ncbi:Abi family protein [Limosilactobacillus viscerum]|uniref:Abi family protein n=1 Tax=Limosilactobacillus viscerum TaxID=2993450 RepID=UPI0024B8B499|nr:Abi family protein [Limosilactobacillus viscerum]